MSMEAALERPRPPGGAARGRGPAPRGARGRGRPDRAASTGAINVVAWGIDWRPGDEIVVTTHLEHPGLSVPWPSSRAGSGRGDARPDRPRRASEDLEAAVARVAGPRTRLVALSHVAWGTGARARRGGGRARGARAAGARRSSTAPSRCGADPGRRRPWTSTPTRFRRTSGCWARRASAPSGWRPRRIERIDLTASGFESGTDHALGGGVVPHPGARRHEVSTLPGALLPGLAGVHRVARGPRAGSGSTPARARRAQAARGRGWTACPASRRAHAGGRARPVWSRSPWPGRDPERACADARRARRDRRAGCRAPRR